MLTCRQAGIAELPRLELPAWSSAGFAWHVEAGTHEVRTCRNLDSWLFTGMLLPATHRPSLSLRSI